MKTNMQAIRSDTTTLAVDASVNAPNEALLDRVIPRTFARALLAAGLLSVLPAGAAPSGEAASATTPQPYEVHRDDAAGTLTLRTPYYTLEHDLKRGGALRRIVLTHGRATNLLAGPLEAWLRDGQGVRLSDLGDAAPRVEVRHDGLREIVAVDAALVDPQGRAAAMRVKTAYTYRWGFLSIQRTFVVPTNGFSVRELSPATLLLAPGLTHYGYREGQTEEDGAPPFSFGSNRWGSFGNGAATKPPLQLRHLPRSMLFLDPGVEGLEWFAGSDLSQWDFRPGGVRIPGRAVLERRNAPAAVSVSLLPIASTTTPVLVAGSCAFDFHLGFPVLSGSAQRPWLHTSFNRNRGNWVSGEQIAQWAAQGYQTVHCHNDGDAFGDGLFWRDGSYPPYPDMDRYDRVLTDCRKAGIRTATYFSNKELHPSTEAFQVHGVEWGRMNAKGALQHNRYRGESEFGAQMCLRSGWLAHLKFTIDRVLKNHPLDGVYYDWNVALLCCNPRHEGLAETNATARGHWDIDELLDLMEWTRERVGPRGLVIVHDTTTPMFSTENFADHVVATEWGYGKWTDRAPGPDALPLEWTLAGARSRGVISYGTLTDKSPQILHRLFAVEAFLGGVTPWPASAATFDLLPRLKPIGDVTSYRFADWRNRAVKLSDPRCGSAVYSRPGEAWLLLGNLEPTPRDVTCRLDVAQLPVPMTRLVSATRMGADPEGGQELDVRELTGAGATLSLPAAELVLMHLRGDAR